MNTIILTKYNIKFEFLDEFKEGIVKQTSVDDLSYALSAFLMENAYVDYLENEILNEINDVMGNLPIDILERGEETVLLVGNPLSTFVFYGRSSKTIFIPTTDLKEIILSWIEFLKIIIFSNSHSAGVGNVWVIRRQNISDGTFQLGQEFLSGEDWVRANI